MLFESLVNSVGCSPIINCGVAIMYPYSKHVHVYVWVLCMTLFRVLMLTVDHDNTPKCRVYCV